MENNPQFITSFIEIYRNNPCLWKINDQNYSDKRLKRQAYSKLLEFFKTAMPTATVDHVKRKINNLRCAFRKELNKVKSSKSNSSADDVYKPSLWYYDLLLFSADQEKFGSAISSYKFVNETMDVVVSEDSTLATDSPLSTQSPPARSSISSDVTMKKKLSGIKKRRAVINEVVETTRDDDEFDGIGINVACKLRRMDEEQRNHAELLINKILIHGIKGRLQEETDFTGLIFTQPQSTFPPTNFSIASSTLDTNFSGHSSVQSQTALDVNIKAELFDNEFDTCTNIYRENL